MTFNYPGPVTWPLLHAEEAREVSGFSGPVCSRKEAAGKGFVLANKTCHGETNSISVIPGIMMLVLWLVLLNKLIK